ncbi:hypothetical protein IWX48DRAFT_619585 [Phyllosticta citricarpa]
MMRSCITSHVTFSICILFVAASGAWGCKGAARLRASVEPALLASLVICARFYFSFFPFFFFFFFFGPEGERANYQL